MSAPLGAAARIASVAMPGRMGGLPREARGYAVPKFVLWIDGKPDFRVMDLAHLKRCIERKLCWVCGHPLGRYQTFVVGPMCIINRTSSEPPSHHECGEYSVRVCPFLAVPEMRRIETRLPGDVTQSGIGITRNPGVGCLWTVENYTVWRPAKDELLFQMGDPTSVEWWCRGRKATRAEVDESINGGLPILEKIAAEDPQPGALAALASDIARAQPWLPGILS